VNLLRKPWEKKNRGGSRDDIKGGGWILEGGRGRGKRGKKAKLTLGKKREESGGS